MTFEILIKMLDVLNNDGEILVMEDITDGQCDYDDECLREKCKISKYDNISDCMEYFTNESRYRLFIYEKDKPYYEMEAL